MKPIVTSHIWCLDSLSSKIQGSPPVLCVEVVENFHQFLAVLPWRIIVKQVQLRDNLAIEIAEYDPRFLIPVHVDPYRIKTIYRGIDNIPAILRWRQQLNGLAVAVVFFVQRKGKCLQKGGNVTAN